MSKATKKYAEMIKKAAEEKKAAADAKAAEEKAASAAAAAAKATEENPVKAIEFEKLKASTVDNLNIKAKADAFDNILANEKILDGLDKDVLTKILNTSHNFKLVPKMTYSSAEGGDPLHEIDNYLNYKSPVYGASEKMTMDELTNTLKSFGVTNNKNTSDIITALKDWKPIGDKKLNLKSFSDAEVVEKAIKNGGVKIDNATEKKAAALDKVITDINILDTLNENQTKLLTGAAHEYAVRSGIQDSDKITEINNYYKAVTSGNGQLNEMSGQLQGTGESSYLNDKFYSMNSENYMDFWDDEFVVPHYHNDIIQPLVEAHWAPFDAA